ncbi:phage tail domain-containing protein [Staphylococcus simulans]|uniref:phage tail domain-containing protein n=2 Tax=Staphylococcus simulans TaxID=1286 RepID=UPI000D1E3CEA|nr:phage tail domain-containing protein [Staphylococcus simulans]PTJ09108.1 hypothetical protein BU044_11270 [Staphylococcus simulans]
MNYTDLMIVKDNEEFLISNNRLTGDALSVSSFIVGSIIQNQRFKYGDGMNRRVDYGFDDEYRKAKMIVEAKTKYGYDIATLRDAINELFYGTYYIREMRLTYDSDKPVKYESIGKTTGDINLGKPRLVGGKQLKVRNVSEIVQSVDDLWFEFEVDFETVEVPCWETSYTTQDLQKDGYNAVVEKYGLADGVHIDYLNYTPTTNEFSIWNGGNVTIDPRNMYLNIRFLYATSNGTVTLENLTTGEKFEFYRQFSNTHLNLFGAKVMLGTTNWLRESNRKFISLAPGENKFKVSNVTHQGISFEFPFYFK